MPVQALVLTLMLGLGAASSALAADMRVSPTRLFFAPDERVKDILIGNPGQQPLLVELQAFHWTDSQRSPAKEVVLSPPIVRIAPGDSAVVRVGFRQPASQPCESTYRLWVTEVPLAQDGTHEPVLMRTRMDLPLFRYNQPQCQPQLHARANQERREIVIENQGSGHVLVQKLRLRVGEREIPLAIQSLAYILPQRQRAFTLPMNAPLQPALAAELVVGTPNDQFVLPLELQP